MRIYHLYFLILCAAIVLVAMAAAGQEPQAAPQSVDWTNPESIDPSQSGVGDFLDLDVQGWLKTANEAYQSGDYEKAAKYYLAAVRSNMQDSGSIYNLACCYGLMGNAEKASFFLEHAVKAGFTDINWVKNDTDFDKVKSAEIFSTTLSTLETEATVREAAQGEQIFTESSALFGCRVHTPPDFDASKTYTLVIGLHGYGDNAGHFSHLWERFSNPDFIYAAPETPYAFTGGSSIGYSWGVEGPGVNGELWTKSARMTEAYVVNVVSNLKTKYKIDKVFLMGFSQGAFFTYRIGITYHDLFDGLIVFGGELQTDALSKEDIAAGADIPVFIAHGNEDKIVPFQNGLDARDTLDAAGYDVTWHEFTGGHAVPADALQAAQAWMKTK